MHAGMGRLADAQAQWHLALATDFDPGKTGYNAEALRQKLSGSATKSPQPYLPLIRYHDALAILDVGSVEDTPDGVRYSKLILLEQDENGTAYGIDTYEMDCEKPRRRVVSVHAFDASGSLVRRSGASGWLDDRYDDPFMPTERRLVCNLELSESLPDPARSSARMLSAYRASEPVFEWGERRNRYRPLAQP